MLGETPRRGMLGTVSEGSARGTGQLSGMRQPRSSAQWGWPSSLGGDGAADANAVPVELLLPAPSWRDAVSMRKEGGSAGEAHGGGPLSLSQNGDMGAVDTAPAGR